MIVHLNGLPGVGKLTVARALETLLREQGRDVRLVDNHAVINLCYAVTEYGTPIYVEMVRELADLLLRYMEQAPPNRTFIFTNALVAHNEHNRRRYDTIRQLAATRSELFVPIHLTCTDEAQHLARIDTADRRQRQKLIDPQLAKGARSHTIIHDEDAPYALTLDVSTLFPEAAAARIAAHLTKVSQ